MRQTFTPDYHHIVDAATNKKPSRLPVYEHNIALSKLDEHTGKKTSDLLKGDMQDKKKFYHAYHEFQKELGYDVSTMEFGMCRLANSGKTLSGHAPGVIKTRDDFDRFDWENKCDKFFSLYREYIEAFGETLPEGMKGIGGIGNGIFEFVQDLTGYTELCMIKADDPELYRDLFLFTGDLYVNVYRCFLQEYGHYYCVNRMGDDLGFRTSTLLSPDDIKNHIVPQYKRVVDEVHLADRPFLLHSCGNIFDVMDDIIETASIDAKHSNEDQIAPFSEWLEKYGSRIGNFGGIDMNVLCMNSPKEIREYVLNICEQSEDYGGVAIGSGNSIPDYVPTIGYLAYLDAVREYRGE